MSDEPRIIPMCLIKETPLDVLLVDRRLQRDINYTLHFAVKDKDEADDTHPYNPNPILKFGDDRKGIARYERDTFTLDDDPDNIYFFGSMNSEGKTPDYVRPEHADITSGLPSERLGDEVTKELPFTHALVRVNKMGGFSEMFNMMTNEWEQFYDVPYKPTGFEKLLMKLNEGFEGLKNSW